MHASPHVRSLVAALALAGCVDLAHPLGRGVAPAVSRARTEHEAAERARRASLPHVPTDQRERPRAVLTEGGVTHGLLGPLRFDLERGAATPAEQITPEPIDAAVRAAHGWVFVTHSAVYASATFTGRLHLIRSYACAPESAGGPPIDSPAITLHPSRGRAAITAAVEGALWSDGTVAHELELPGAVGLAWRDEAHGAAIVGYRRLLTTHDGGGTWREVDMRGEVPVMVQGDAQGLSVNTDRGVRRVDANDALGPLDDSTPDRARGLPYAMDCDVPGDALAAVTRLVERGYEAMSAPPRERCRRARAPWTSPSFSVRVSAVTRANEGDATWRVAGATPSPFGTPRGRTWAETDVVPALVQVTAPAGVRADARVAFAWRGEDDRGPFSPTARATTPHGLLDGERWTLVAATRRGLLFEISAQEPGTEGSEAPYEHMRTDLFWFSNGAVRRVEMRPSGAGRVVGAIALDDGGAVVLGGAYVERAGRCEGAPVVQSRMVTYALRLGPDGAELARRTSVDVTPARASVDATPAQVVGLGVLDGRWGLVVAGRDVPDALTLLPFGGGEVPFGRWRVEGAPAVCADDVGSATLHVLRSDDVGATDEPRVRIVARDDREDLASARLVTLERAGDAVCVRRVWGAHRAGAYDYDAEDVRDLWGAVRFTARGGRLEGRFDDGARVATIEGAVIDVSAWRSAAAGPR